MTRMHPYCVVRTDFDAFPSMLVLPLPVPLPYGTAHQLLILDASDNYRYLRQPVTEVS